MDHQKRKFWIAGSYCLILTIACIIVFRNIASITQFKSNLSSDVLPLKKHRDRSKIVTPRTAFLEEKEPARIIILATRLREMQGLVEKQIEDSLISKLPLFRADQLGQLTIFAQESGYRELILAIRKTVAEFDSAESLELFLQQLPQNNDFRDDVLFELGRSSKLFSSESISHTLEDLEKIDLAKLGSGLAARISLLPMRERERETREFLSLVSNPALTAPLTAAFVKTQLEQSPKSAAILLDWLLTQDPDLTRDADPEVIKATAKIDTKISLDFINRLIELNQMERASKAAYAFSQQFGTHSPRETFEWAISLPPEFPDRILAIGSVFATLVRREPETAQKLLNSVEDLSMRKKLEVIQEVTLKEVYNNR